jgi:hypothetical protein
VNCGGPLGEERGEGYGQGEGSLSPTREECGRAFAPELQRGISK